MLSMRIRVYFLEITSLVSIMLQVLILLSMSASGGKLFIFLYEPVREKTNDLGSDQVRHKLPCTVTEDDLRLEILDLESRGIVLSV